MTQVEYIKSLIAENRECQRYVNERIKKFSIPPDHLFNEKRQLLLRMTELELELIRAT